MLKQIKLYIQWLFGRNRQDEPLVYDFDNLGPINLEFPTGITMYKRRDGKIVVFLMYDEGCEFECVVAKEDVQQLAKWRSAHPQDEFVV